MDEKIVCKDCGKEIPELDVFPGPLCLECHAKWFDSVPLSQHEKPDFTKVISKGHKRRNKWTN